MERSITIKLFLSQMTCSITIGDYLAVGIDDVTIFNSSEKKDFFIGVHAGLSEEEMYVPFIIIDRK